MKIPFLFSVALFLALAFQLHNGGSANSQTTAETPSKNSSGRDHSGQVGKADHPSAFKQRRKSNRQELRENVELSKQGQSSALITSLNHRGPDLGTVLKTNAAQVPTLPASFWFVGSSLSLLVGIYLFKGNRYRGPERRMAPQRTDVSPTSESLSDKQTNNLCLLSFHGCSRPREFSLER